MKEGKNMVEIVIHDTLTAMRSVLTRPVAERKDAYHAYIVEPLRDYWQPLVSRFAPHMANDDAMVMKLLWDVDLEADAANSLVALQRLEQANTWARSYDALQTAVHSFESAGRSCLVERVEAILTLGNPRDELFMQLNKGYVGAQCPGYVSILVWPTDYNLPRIPSALAHEFHHRVRLTHEPWTQHTSVGQYIVLEGLAESFAGALFGEEFVGPWVTSLNADEMAHSKEVIAEALDVTGFDQIRGYLFGDQLATRYGFPAVGLPYCAGYTIGYQVVQSYLRTSGKTIIDATFTPFAEIIEQSKFFV
jgi:uncharacterized protein YjaZ